MINQGMFPPGDAIMIEEFINYFDNDYTKQNEYENDVPFNIYMAIATSPYAEKPHIMRIGLKDISLNLH